MDILELGRALIEPDTESEEAYNTLTKKALEAIEECTDVELLIEFIEMDTNLEFPINIRGFTLERLLHLGDYSRETVGAYWSHLGLHFSFHPLESWLGAEVKRIEQTGKNPNDYRKLGEELANRLSEPM